MAGHLSYLYECFVCLRVQMKIFLEFEYGTSSVFKFTLYTRNCYNGNLFSWRNMAFFIFKLIFEFRITAKAKIKIQA